MAASANNWDKREQDAANFLTAIHVSLTRTREEQLDDQPAHDPRSWGKTAGMICSNPILVQALGNNKGFGDMQKWSQAQIRLLDDPVTYLQENQPLFLLDEDPRTRLKQAEKRAKNTIKQLEMQKVQQVKLHEQSNRVLSAQASNLLQHFSMSASNSPNEHGVFDINTVLLAIMRPAKEGYHTLKQAIHSMLPEWQPPDRDGISLADHTATIHRLMSVLGYLEELNAYKQEHEPGTEPPLITTERLEYGDRTHLAWAMVTMPKTLKAHFRQCQTEYNEHHKFTPGGPPALTTLQKIKQYDTYALSHPAVRANYSHGAGSGTGRNGSTTRAGTGAGPGTGATAAAAAAAAATAAAAAGAGAGAGARAAGPGNNSVDTRPLLTSGGAPSAITYLPPCPVINCGRQYPSPYHTPGLCARNPANMHNGMPGRVAFHCLKCGVTPQHAGGCTATDAQKANFALTEIGQRCAYWRAHKQVRAGSKNGVDTTPITHAHAHHAMSVPSPGIILDGGTNRTMVGKDVPLEDLKHANGMAEGIGGVGLPIIGKGRLKVTHELTIPALQVEGLQVGIISESELLNSSPDVAISTPAAPRGQHKKEVMVQERVLFTAQERDGFFEVQLVGGSPAATQCSQEAMSAQSAQRAAAYVTQSYYEEHRTFYNMHHRLNHLPRGRMEKLIRTRAMAGLPEAATFKWPSEDWSCITCQQSKMRGSGHPSEAPEHRTATHRSSDLYIDIIDLPNGKYGLHVRDKWGGYNSVDIADKKGAAAEFVQQRVHQRHTRDKVLGGVLRVHSDIDVSMLNKETKAYFKREGIELVPYSISDPQAHGFVERPHADMWAYTRCSRADYLAAHKKELPMELYHWALQHAVQSLNCVPRGDETQSPYELEHDRKPDYAERWTFGEPCVIKVLPTPADKSAPRGVQAQHFGMVEGSSTLHKVLLHYKTKAGKDIVRVVITRTVARIFDDDVMLAGSPTILTEEECSLEALDAMTYNLWNGKNATECQVCNQPGELLLCSYCPNSMHLECVGLDAMPEDDYRCAECCEALGLESPQRTVRAPPGPTDAPAVQQCRKSVNCPKPDQHVTRCARRSIKDTDTTLPAAATTTTPPATDTTTATQSPGKEDDAVPPSTRRMYLAELQQKHTDKSMQMKDKEFYDKEMTHVERRTMVRNSELRWRRTPEAQARRLNKAERREKHQLQAEIKAAQNAGKRGQRPGIDRLRRQVDKIITMPVSRMTTPSTPAMTTPEAATTAAVANHISARSNATEEGIKEEQYATAPDFIKRMGYMRVPVGGVGSEDGVWVNQVTGSSDTHTPHARDIPKPQNHNEAKMSAQWPSWQAAEQAEIKQLQDRGTVTVVEGTEARGNIVLGMTWSYKVKDVFDIVTDTWTGIQYKARLNIRGDQQKEEHINPDHRSSPTADMDSIRLLFATLAGVPGVEFLKFDVVAAFLNAKLDPNAPPIYMRGPQGMQLEPGQMLRLNANIYGLVEAAYLWFMEISTTLQQQGWVQGNYDPCIFNYPSDTEPSRLVLHVDDGIIGGINVAARYEALAGVYDMKNLGTRPTQFLGMELFHTKDGFVLLHNQQYIEQLIESWATHTEHPLTYARSKRRNECHSIRS